MQTIHFWPPHHLLLAGNAKAAEHLGKVEELLVVVEDGVVQEVYPPPSPEGRFRGMNWLPGALTSAWQRGTRNSTELKAPPGWVLRGDLRPGMLAHDGDERWVLLFQFHWKHHANPTALMPDRQETRKVYVVTLPTEHRTESVFLWDPAEKNASSPHFYRILAQDLSQEQCVKIRDMCKHATPEQVIRALGLVRPGDN